MSSFNPSPALAWTANPADENAIVDLFLGQISPQYISHSELQGDRADGPGAWRVDLADTVRAQVRDTLGQAPETATSLIAVARQGDRLAAVAFVSLDQQKLASASFALLDDLVVHPDFRSGGLGGQLLDWIGHALVQRGVKRLFLESGAGNTRAHRFFEAHGYAPVSVVMFKELAAAAPSGKEARP